MDPELVNDIPAEAEVLKRKIWDPSAFVQKSSPKGVKDGYSRMEDPSRFMKLMKWIRGNIFVPDSRILWVSGSIKYLSEYLKLNPVDVIVTSGPPHSMHLIGEGLAKKIDVPWIMDLRDPMSQLITNQELYMSIRTLKKYRRIESRLLNRASAIISTAPRMTELLEDFDEDKFTVITNGFDRDDFDIDPVISVDPFVMTYTGLLNKYRIPHKLLSILDTLLKVNDSFRSRFEFNIAGVVTEEFHHELEHFPALKSKTTFLGYISHKEVIENYNNSTALLLLMNNDDRDVAGSIPGKLFEYLAARRPILSLGPENSSLIHLFTSDQYSGHFSYDDEPGIKSFMEQLVSREQSFTLDQNSFEAYSRKNLTARLVRLLEQLIEQS